MHAAAERREHADAPVADLVAEALDHDRPVGRHRARRGGLLAEEREQVARRALVEVVLAAEPDERGRVAERRELARGGADLLPELVRPPDALALPERHRARQARRRRDEHAVAGDLLDPPRRGAEQERLARARLVHHLLVELADAAAAVDEEHAEESAVRDRAGVRDREPARAVAGADRAAGAVPHDPRPELGELVGRVAAGEHVEHVLELDARELGERVRAADEVVQLADVDLLVGRDRDDLLREHVERVARDVRLLDLAAAHRPRDDRRLEQVGAELREDAPLRDGAELVPRAADPLQPARDRFRRLDLDHEVDRAHVDPELERRGRDEARDPAGLQVLLDEHALLPRERAVMGARDLPLGELVQAQREPLGEAAVVHEHDRRAVRLDEPQHLGVDRRPDRLRAELGAGVHLLSVGGHRIRERRRRAELAHVLDRDDDLEVELLPRPRVDELDRPAARDEAADLLERPLRRGEAEPLERPLGDPLESLDREREVRAALRPRQRVDLVEDQRLDPAEALARGRGEHQVERLGRRDQDVRRFLHERAALLHRGVAGADADTERRLEPGERPAEVALDVVVERLQRRDVEHAQPRARARGEPVDRVQERGQRLPRPGRRLDQDVRARRDRRPAERLRRRRRRERALEPGSRRR